MLLRNFPPLFVLITAVTAAQTVDLAGTWRFALDPEDEIARTAPGAWRFPDLIQLPGILTAQGYGNVPNIRTNWTGDEWKYPELFKEWQADENFKMPFFLQPPRHYLGAAWYERDIEIPADWREGEAWLWLERVHWQSTVWLDGHEVGRADSLGTPHEFELGSVAPGRHRLTLRIDNRLDPVNVGPLSHSVTDHTQGNWNGVVGAIELRRRPASRIDSVQVYPAIDGTARVRVSGRLGGEQTTGQVEVRLEGAGAAAPLRSAQLPPGPFEVELHGLLAVEPTAWSEYSPKLYRLAASLSVGGGEPADRHRVSFGFREVGTRDGRITLNGRKIFLRGTLECAIFPLEGHPRTDVEWWRRVIRICKAHGLNHIRFHSWCPPEAAFAAADELGFYYQVEASSWANRGPRLGDGEPVDAWIEAETERMLRTYGNHPSFMLMAYGNEPGGPNHVQWLEGWVKRRQAGDPRRLYTTAAGWPVQPGSDYHNSPRPRLQRWGLGLKSIFNGEPPRTDFDWTATVAEFADAPTVAHEIGQWCVYPNFSEIAKYTGHFKARNFEIFRETARRNGLLPQARDFLMASGRWQAMAYKHDIEAALRTPGFGGFQLLDLHDFPGQGTALVGVLDAFWEEKGYISAEEFHRFCGPIVPLARLKQMVFTSAETLEADVEIAQFGPADLRDAVATWTLAQAGGAIIGHGQFAPRNLATGELHRIGTIAAPLAEVNAPAQLRLTVRIEGSDSANAWDVFVYPAAIDVSPPPGIVVTENLGQAKAALARGERVLWMPRVAEIRDDPERPLIAGFSPMFWNTVWTDWQPPHTLGILCDPTHPALARFPTDAHSNWQWWDIQRESQPFILTRHATLRPVVQVIDDWVTNRKLAYVFEARVGPGRLLACAAQLARGSAGPSTRQLLASLQAYASSDKFAPAFSLTPEDLDALVVERGSPTNVREQPKTN